MNVKYVGVLLNIHISYKGCYCNTKVHLILLSTQPHNEVGTYLHIVHHIHNKNKKKITSANIAGKLFYSE